MPIKVTREDLGEPAEERCAFCWERTAYWYERHDVAVCSLCAAKVKPSEVPLKKDWWHQKTGIHVLERAEAVVDAVAEALGVDTGTVHESRMAAAVEAVLKVRSP